MSGDAAFLVLRGAACRIGIAFLLPLPASGGIGVLGLHLVLMYLLTFLFFWLSHGWVSGVSRRARLFLLFVASGAVSVLLLHAVASVRVGPPSSPSAFSKFLVRSCLVHGGHIRVSASGIGVLDVLFLPDGIACFHLHLLFLSVLFSPLCALDVIDRCRCLVCSRSLLYACCLSFRPPGLSMFIHVALP